VSATIPGSSRLRAALVVAVVLGCGEAPPPRPEFEADSGSPALAPVDSIGPGAAFVPRDSVVFAFEVSPHEYVSFEPLFQLDADTMSGALPEQGSAEGDLLERLWYSPGTKYHAMSGGVHVGVIRLEGAALAGCTGLPGDASFVEKVPAAPLRGLAFAREPASHDFVVEPTAAEDSIARAALVERLRAAGVADSALVELVWEPVHVVVTPDGARTVITSAGVHAFEDAERQAHGHVVIEATPAGTRVADASADDGRAIDSAHPEFFDAADLDGDGAPEIVVRNHYYESWDYTIYRRIAGRWQRVFSGGGSGC